MERPIIIVRVEGGQFLGIDFAGDADVFCHDAACLSEPLYKMTLQVKEADLRSEVGDGPWPNADDERHPAIVARFEQDIEGKPRLSLVSESDDGR